MATLKSLREQFPDLGVRVDFHERFARPDDFYTLLPALERLRLDWIEEPFAMGPAYAELKRRTRLRVAAGEIFWGDRRFAEIRRQRWADVIMPDVKHVGGFGPLLDVFKASAGTIEVSPHNPVRYRRPPACMLPPFILTSSAPSSTRSTGSRPVAGPVNGSRPACCC